MLKNIVPNFIYNKVFKETNIADLKNFYKKELKHRSKTTFLFIIPTTVILGVICKHLGDSIFPGILLIPLFIISILASFASILSILYYLSGYFSIKKQINNIKEKRFELMYIKSPHNEYFQFNSSGFINSKANKVLHEKLNSKELLLLNEELKNHGIEEKQIKEILKSRMIENNNPNITLEDFCFLIREMEKRINNNKKIHNFESILNNMFSEKQSEEIMPEENNEKEKMLILK